MNEGAVADRGYERIDQSFAEPSLMALKLRWWEALLLVVPALHGLVFLLAGNVAAGVVLLAVVALVVASRAQVVERNVPGGYARARGYLNLAKAGSLFAIYVVAMVLFFIARRDHWIDDTPGLVAVYALATVAFFLLREINRVGDQAIDYLIGGEMEARVARELDPFREKGWLVSHDLKKDAGGNVDHFLSGPHGAIAVETKSGRDSARARGQAAGNAAWAKQKFGERRFVTAVLCVGTDPPPAPQKKRWTWVMGVEDIGRFVREYTGSS
jgi:hypothetical protein